MHFLQIWIVPKFTGIKPSYEQKYFSPEDKRGRLRIVAAPDGREDSVAINQDANIYATLLDGDEEVSHTLLPGRRAYVHVATGKLRVNGELLAAGDGAKISGESKVILQAAGGGEALLFDLP